MHCFYSSMTMFLLVAGTSSVVCARHIYLTLSRQSRVQPEVCKRAQKNIQTVACTHLGSGTITRNYESYLELDI